MRVKMSKQPPSAPTASAVGPCPTLIQTSRTPRTWKFIQDHRIVSKDAVAVRTITGIFLPARGGGGGGSDGTG